MRARDLMVRLGGHLGPDDTVSYAVTLMHSARRDAGRTGVKALVVLDPSGRLIGIVSMRDILKAAWPSYMEHVTLGEFAWDGMLEQMARRTAGRKVSEIMTREVISVREDAPLMECVDHIIKHRVRRLPVVDAEGRVAGMLYERDVFFAVAGAMLGNGDAK